MSRKSSRADAVAANVDPAKVSADFDTARAAAEAAAHASSAVAAQMAATDQGPAAASDAVAQGTDVAARRGTAREGQGPAAEDGLRALETAADAPADATALVEDGDPISWAARNFSIRG